MQILSTIFAVIGFAVLYGVCGGAAGVAFDEMFLRRREVTADDRILGAVSSLVLVGLCVGIGIAVGVYQGLNL